jgi:hypothetical protein
MRPATRPIINSMAMDGCRPVTLSAALLALGLHLRARIRTVSDLIERHFAEFAGVPHQNPNTRQQWEELWESEAEL